MQLYLQVLKTNRQFSITGVMYIQGKTVAVVRAALTIGLGGAEAPGPEQGGGP